MSMVYFADVQSSSSAPLPGLHVFFFVVEFLMFLATSHSGLPFI